MHTKAGTQEDRNSPWAKVVMRQEKVAIFDEVFWDPPEVNYSTSTIKYINIRTHEKLLLLS